ncbi:hypothetical protein ACJVDH_00420 [Pedobacter sp. AW1-32]|uniref:hypothetical protein n=1 Tax=Pedobacter sp. AW1-32 TaxID=3383026 RepID=UPI003FF0A925
MELGIPETLCMEGKPIDVPFVNGELIYRRHNELLIGNLLDLDLKVLERIFHLTNDSHNRSSLSVAEDVLINEDGKIFDDHGIISLPINEISKNMRFNFQNGKQDSVCRLSVVYDPKECNYAHCEIHCFIDDVRRIEGKPPKSAKPFFRRELLKIMNVIKQKKAS